MERRGFAFSFAGTATAQIAQVRRRRINWICSAGERGQIKLEPHSLSKRHLAGVTHGVVFLKPAGRGIESAAANGDRCVPLPLTSATQRELFELLLCLRRPFEDVRDTQDQVPRRRFGAVFYVLSRLNGIYDTFFQNTSAARKNDAIRAVWKLPKGVHELQVLAILLEKSGSRVGAAILEEQESTRSDSLRLSVRVEWSTELSEATEAAPSNFLPIPPTPKSSFGAEILPLCCFLGAQIFASREVFDISGVRVNGSFLGIDSEFADASDLRMYTDSDRRQDGTASVARLETPVLETISVEQLEMLSRAELVRILRQSKVAAKSSASREELIALALPYMDEIQRRLWNMARAVEAQDFGRAAMLEQGKSARHRAYDQLNKAVELENYAAAQLWLSEFQILTRQRHDITQDEGSYDRDLDADPWYRPQ
ncbi:hypothetical protein FVE85_6157 [Porphyridium purpureum]|uniref:SAP domain-containing protein n=1 Tax=Porphyridium purpureum TaxID=35688 RepID=A0A5J4Z652_PORPP|nr:hypothetical protein FVE85_6157 [Porphyridium purpureum]|eukprot:POR1052..scf295_1